MSHLTCLHHPKTLLEKLPNIFRIHSKSFKFVKMSCPKKFSAKMLIIQHTTFQFVEFHLGTLPRPTVANVQATGCFHRGSLVGSMVSAKALGEMQLIHQGKDKSHGTHKHRGPPGEVKKWFSKAKKREKLKVDERSKWRKNVKIDGTYGGNLGWN